MREKPGNKRRYVAGNEVGLLLCLNTILRIYRMDRMVLHPVNRLILKIVFKMRERACGVLRARAFFFAALREKKPSAPVERAYEVI
jgi:hypothetical protein